MAFILFTTMTSLFNVFIFFVCHCLFFHKFETMGAEFGISPGSPFFSFIARQKSIMNEIFFITSVVDMAFIGIFGLIFSHKISGPIHRLEKFLLTVATDNLHSIQARKGDFFPELYAALRVFINKFEKKSKKS